MFTTVQQQSRVHEVKVDYKKAGVDIDAANQAVKKIKKLATGTKSKAVLGNIGLFGGCFALNKQDVLVSATDGVGTKLKLAFMLNKHDTVGIDLVAMNVNDLICQGAKPLFFLDYIGCNKVDPRVIAQIVKGIVKGCKQAGCALIGGEIAELGDLYKKGEYDLAGFTVGVVKRKKLIDGSKIKPGDQIIGLASSGLHSNGFSLARKVLSSRLAAMILKPTKIYVQSILKLLAVVPVNGIAHITGGGLYENIERLLRKGLKVKIDRSSWRVPPIFKLIQKRGKVTEKELFRTFNMGIGMAIILDSKKIDKAISILERSGEKVFEIGEIIAR
ncbi:phosphoribosylformylglycinamidine cyclo-ligase [Candidatus Margulisiibacteriota bacterium]